MQYTRYGERELWQGDLMSGPYAFDGGYVVCVSGRTLIFGRGDDNWAVRREEDLGQWLDDRCPSRAQAQLLDTDPPTGRIMVRRGDWIAVLDGRDGTVLAGWPRSGTGVAWPSILLARLWRSWTRGR